MSFRFFDPVRKRWSIYWRWQQAFSENGGETWETNWVMDLTRVRGRR